MKKGKDAAIRRKHHWVFSGAIKKILGQPEDGDVVEVYSSQSEFLALGHYKDGTISVRIFSFKKMNPDRTFWVAKIQNAYNVRKLLGLTASSTTNAYRLIHGEGDGLPGLVIDFYNGTCVFQAHSIGMHKSRTVITQALVEVLGDSLKAVYDKSQNTLPSEYAKSITNSLLHGSESDSYIEEYGHQFFVDWNLGQKTGFFLDQRENRKLLADYSKGKKVLNAFCYSGGFSVYALQAGATLVHSVDASKRAMEWTAKNVALNPNKGEHKGFAMDVLKFLKELETPYDVMVLDPPAYAKTLKARHRAVQGYKRLNVEGMKKLKSGGILFTFSCSQVVDLKLFKGAIMAAALEAGRSVRILHTLSQPADHPINIFHPEVSYLKGLVLHVI